MCSNYNKISVEINGTNIIPSDDRDTILCPPNTINNDKLSPLICFKNKNIKKIDKTEAWPLKWHLNYFNLDKNSMFNGW